MATNGQGSSNAPPDPDQHEEVDVVGNPPEEGNNPARVDDECGEFGDELHIVDGHGEDRRASVNTMFSLPPLRESSPSLPDIQFDRHNGPVVRRSSFQPISSTFSSVSALVSSSDNVASQVSQSPFPGSHFNQIDPLELMWMEFRSSVVKYVPLEERLAFIEGLDTLLKANRLVKLQKTFLKPRKPPVRAPAEKRGRGRPRKRLVDDDTPMELGSQPKRGSYEHEVLKDLLQMPSNVSSLRQLMAGSSSSSYQEAPSFAPRPSCVPDILREAAPFLHPFPQHVHETPVSRQYNLYDQKMVPADHNEPTSGPSKQPSDPDGRSIQEQMPVLAQMINSNE